MGHQQTAGTLALRVCVGTGSGFCWTMKPQDKAMRAGSPWSFGCSGNPGAVETLLLLCLCLGVGVCFSKYSVELGTIPFVLWTISLLL